MCVRHPSRIARPPLRQVQCPVDKSMAVPRDIGREHADLAIDDLAPTGSSPVAEGLRARVLPPDTAGGLALLQKTGLVNDQNGVIRRQVFERIVAHNIAQSVSIPAAPPKDRLLPPGARVSSRLGAHPA